MLREEEPGEERGPVEQALAASSCAGELVGSSGRLQILRFRILKDRTAGAAKELGESYAAKVETRRGGVISTPTGRRQPCLHSKLYEYQLRRELIKGVLQ